MSSDSQIHSDLDTRLAAMLEPSPDPECLYHAMTLTADDDLNVMFGTQTAWVGWTEDGRHEVRQSRLVYRNFVEGWKLLNLPYCFVHTLDDLSLYLVAGGNALVENKLAENIFPDLLGPRPSIPSGPVGYKDANLFDSSAFRRAPTPRLRMKIFDRDQRRCRICGRRPDDNTDLVLHIHHIRPWEKGGVTDPSNLITLCHTCHTGLMPHEDHSLFEYISSTSDDAINTLLRFSKGVSNYRRVGFFGIMKTDDRSRGKTRRDKRPKSSVSRSPQSKESS